MKTFFTLLVSALLFSSPNFGQAGTLDSSFGNNGIRLADSGSYHTAILQKDQKIIAAGLGHLNGIFGFILDRFNTDGSIDKSFGYNGRVATAGNVGYDGVISLGIQQNKKIIAAGRDVIYTDSGANHNYAVLLTRYLPDGRLDSSFGLNGIMLNIFDFYLTVTGMALQPDDKIVVIGNYTFAQYGFSRPFIMRYLPDGKLDSSFAQNGQLFEPELPQTEYKGVSIQPDGKIVVGATYQYFFYPQFGIVRYLANGSHDQNFGNKGLALQKFFNSEDPFAELSCIALQPDGKIIAGGTAARDQGTSSFALARFDNTGKPDKSFGKNGRIITEINNGKDEGIIQSIALQKNNKIVAAGWHVNYNKEPHIIYFKLACYLPNGNLDSSFAINGLQSTEFVEGYTVSDGQKVIIQKDNKIVVAGYAQSPITPVIARYNSDSQSPLFASVNNPLKKNISLQTTIQLSPNPVKDLLTIQGLKTSALSTITIFDISGKRIISAKTQSSTYSFNVATLRSGTYLVQIINEGKLNSLKFVKQ